MLSNRPYLLRAFHQWIIDSGCTPILVIDANHPRCKIPQDYIEGGEIVFNISSSAVRDLQMSNDLVEFKASFSGVIHIICVPITAILAVYAEENGEGLFFDAEEETGSAGSGGVVQLKGIDGPAVDIDSIEQGMPPIPSEAKSKPFLKLVE
jgi:stringent starvation protein B